MTLKNLIDNWEYWYIDEFSASIDDSDFTPVDGKWSITIKADHAKIDNYDRKFEYMQKEIDNLKKIIDALVQGNPV